MTRFIVFMLLLLIGRHVRGVTENIVTSMSGFAVTLKAQSVEYASRCTLETNRGKELKYVPGCHQIREDLECIDNTCSLRIDKANDSHAGVWKVTAYTVKPNTTKNEEDVDFRSDITPEVFLSKLYIHEEKAIFPQYIEVYDGHYIYIKHNENYKNLKACNLTGPKMKPINLLTEKQDNFQLSGQCGVRMKVNPNFEGSWKLDAMIDYVLYRISFNIKVHQLKEKDLNNTLVVQWIRGSPGIISLSDQPQICQIVDPHGVIVATSKFNTKKCYYQVKVATVAHEGIWLARYNMYGMIEPIEQKFRVETLDRIIFNASVTQTENNSTMLFCRLEIKDANLDSCNFVKPDGMILYMTPAVGTERYITHVKSANKNERTDYKILECAITIRKLEDVDYGAWRCDMILSTNDSMNHSYGSVLHVDYPDSYKNASAKDKAVKTRADDVHVKRGDPFMIKCVVDFVLKYCWLRSPNGTSYSITHDTEAVSPFVLRYQSNGLAFGECGVEISAAVDSDNGQWRCSMGVADAGEISAVALVAVTETYLVAEQTEIAVSPRNDPVLSCHILPRMLDRTVHYCRWIRPDGYGIYNDISHRYTTNSSYSQCRLVIRDYRPDEDDGNWTCVAGLIGKNDRVEEAWDQIEVHQYVSKNTAIFIVTRLTIVVIGITTIIFVFGGLGYAWGKYLLRRSLRKLQADNQQKYYPSKSLQSKFVTRDYTNEKDKY